jgi:hypothetical protein
LKGLWDEEPCLQIVHDILQAGSPSESHHQGVLIPRHQNLPETPDLGSFRKFQNFSKCVGKITVNR